MRAGRRFVLVIDEAQNLDEKVLESIRLLSNFETPWTKLMQIVLAGQPQLADRLASPSMAQLRQRVSMVIRIEPLTPDEVNAYIDHRLWIAGCEKPAFLTVGARKLIADHSEGIPRNINNLCFNAMSLACALQRKTIDRDIVRDVITDLDLEPLREKNIAPLKSENEIRARSAHAGRRRTEAVILRRLDSQARDHQRSVAHCGRAPRQLESQRRSIIRAAGRCCHRVGRAASGSGCTPSVRLRRCLLLLPFGLRSAPTPVVVSEVSLMPAEEASATVKQATEDVRVKSGQTLYQISVNKFGKYDGKVLEQLRGLNPSLSNPDRIRTGQKIRIPATATLSTDGQHAGQQSPNAAPTEAGKP